MVKNKTKIMLTIDAIVTQERLEHFDGTLKNRLTKTKA